MLTNNGLAILRRPIYEIGYALGSNEKFRDINNVERTLFTPGNATNKTGACIYVSTASSFNSNPAASTGAGIMLGNGLVAPTVNDYDITSKITSGLTCTGITWSALPSTGSARSFKGLFGVTNISSSPITVTEIGLYNFLYYSESSGIAALIDHTMLSTPLTIPAGDSASIQYILNFEIPGNGLVGNAHVDVDSPDNTASSAEGQLI